MIKSQALEINLASYHVEVDIDAKYSILQEVMSKYYGLMEGLNTFLKELSHPYKNWQYIVIEARGYSLDYFHLLKNHPKGHDAADLFVNIFSEAIELSNDMEVKIEAADNLLLFLQKVIKDSGSDLKKFTPMLNGSFNLIRNYEDEYFFLFVKSFYQIKRLAEILLNHTDEFSGDFKVINLLLLKYFQHTYSYWLSEKDPKAWFNSEVEEKDYLEQIADFFKDISHKKLHKWHNKLEDIAHIEDIESEDVLKRLLQLPGYNQFVEIYRNIPQRLLNAGTQESKGNEWKLILLFHIMNISGLSMIHEETLRDINRTLSWLIDHEKSWNVDKLIRKTFSILKARTNEFPATALDCVLNMGRSVYKTDESDQINFFIESAIDLGFQSPMLSGVGNDWQVKVNSAHIQNIRTWLELIELNPKWSTKLLSCLIIHISLCGVFIKDTDLFPRDITKFLNSDIEPVYNLAKQLTRLFPAFFNDIGAEGKLRDISTNIDEVIHRRDILIHFLRKQSHVESSNRIIDFMEAVLNFWETREKSLVEPFVPPSIYDQIDVRGLYIDGVYRVMSHLKGKGLSLPHDFLDVNEEKLKNLLEDISGVSDEDLERVKLAASFYKLLHHKYNLDFIEMDSYIAQLSSEAFPDLSKLKNALNEPDLKIKTFELLNYLELLKKIVLSPQSYEIREDIYQKRHFTVDIPSMYGSYHEIKFDALGLTFRIESLVNVLFEELIRNIDLNLITKATFYQIFDLLMLFDKALKLKGISSAEIEPQLDLLAHSLEVKEFTLTQYLDIFKGFVQAVKNIINDYFNNVHGQNLTRILSQIAVDQILEKYLPKKGMDNHEKLKHRVSEIFFRDRIALSLGLQQLDLFLSRILNTLFHQTDKLSKDKLHLLFNYDPQRAITYLINPSNRVAGIIYLGNKGLNMVKLKNFGFPVPPGFIITTEVFRCREIIDSYPPAAQNFKEQITHHVSVMEKITDKSFGDPKNPLLFSVRSGSSISQPGMMDTFLNVGINEEIAEGLAVRTGNKWFAWDCYRRFLQGYGMAHGLDRDDFDAIIKEHKEKVGIPLKRGFTGEQMKQVALAYKDMIRDEKIYILEDPFDQLHVSIKSVIASWESPKAKTYRQILGISEDWGTAVTVQEMVFGNNSRGSGSGVIFTHDPKWSRDTIRLWGDFTIGNQGEDVVSGLVNTLPISITQQDIEMRETYITLETDFPEIYKTLEDWANNLIYKKGWSPQEIEFTFESPSAKDLYLLQTRDMTMRERKTVFAFDLEGVADEKVIGHGIGVSGGAMSGRAVFSLEEIDEWRTREGDTSLILVRSDTVPDDIKEIHAADGILTARGGLTSHAAVVAHRLEKTCVVGCGELVCNEKKKECHINEVLIRSGDYLSIDGHQGSIYQGLMKVKEA